MPLNNPVAQITESGLVLADNTTDNASVSAHGLAPKADGSTAHYLNGAMSWATPAPGLWLPSDFGFISWAYDPVAAAGNTVSTGGTVVVSRIHVPVACSVTNVIVAIATAGNTLTAGQCFAGLYQGGAIIGTTADQHSAWTSNNIVPIMPLQSLTATITGFSGNGTTVTLTCSGGIYPTPVAAQTVTIAGCTSTPTINGAQTILASPAPTSTSFSFTSTATSQSGLGTAIVSGPFAVSAGEVYVAWYAVGTTIPAWSRALNFVTLGNLGLTTTARFGTADTGRTTSLPATLGTITAAAYTYWAAIS